MASTIRQGAGMAGCLSRAGMAGCVSRAGMARVQVMNELVKIINHRESVNCVSNMCMQLELGSSAQSSFCSVVVVVFPLGKSVALSLSCHFVFLLCSLSILQIVSWLHLVT